MSEYIIQAEDWATDCNGDSLYKDCQEVVRCGDCKHIFSDNSWCLLHSMPAEYYGFCSWAERRGGK